LQGVFDGSRTADETAGKPDPLMLQELMQEFGVAPERVLMVGDTTHDLQMALNAGVPSVGVSYGAHEPDTLPPCSRVLWPIRWPNCMPGLSQRMMIEHP
jgi:phosphoglycolate phosphatase